MASKTAPIGPGGGKQSQDPQLSNMDSGPKEEGLNQNKDIIESVRKTIFRIQRKLDKQPDGSSSTKDIRDVIMKLERILKSK